MATTAPLQILASAVKVHLSLNVSDLRRSIGFYQPLFGVEPAKCYPDYAKFELECPPFVLSLEPQPHAAGGSLNHLGFRLPDAAALVDIQRRLESAGISTTREDGVECCYARQSKFWVQDPDGNNWEMYVLEKDVEHRGTEHASQSKHGPSANHAAATTPPEVIWEHQLGTDFPSIIPLADASADQVLLRGTFNVPLSANEQLRILREARRVLRQGGRLLMHGLVGDSAPTGPPPSLPGPAAAVRHAPQSADVLAAIQTAGFGGLRITKLSASPVFRHNGVALRELMAEARRIDASPFDLRQAVLYLGPMRELADDAGNIYRRGEKVSISTCTAELLRGGPLVESFLFFPPGGEA